MSNWNNIQRSDDEERLLLWSAKINPWELESPWEYEPVDPIAWTNNSQNSSSWTNIQKSIFGAGEMIGFPFGITKTGSTNAPWINQSKN